LLNSRIQIEQLRHDQVDGIFPVLKITLQHIYLPHAQTAIYDSKVKLFLKQGISHQLGRDEVVRFECENSAIDVIINFL
jgi:hypothetical protein